MFRYQGRNLDGKRKKIDFAHSFRCFSPSWFRESHSIMADRKQSRTMPFSSTQTNLSYFADHKALADLWHWDRGYKERIENIMLKTVHYEIYQYFIISKVLLVDLDLNLLSYSNSWIWKLSLLNNGQKFCSLNIATLYVISLSFWEVTEHFHSQWKKLKIANTVPIPTICLRQT